MRPLVPMTLAPGEMEELFALAKEHRVVLVERLTLVYLRAFTQLVFHQSLGTVMRPLVPMIASSFSTSTVVPISMVASAFG